MGVSVSFHWFGLRHSCIVIDLRLLIFGCIIEPDDAMDADAETSNFVYCLKLVMENDVSMFNKMYF